MLNDSLTIQSNKEMDTVLLLKPTSKKAIIAKIVVITTLLLLIICDPVTPDFLPKNPDTVDPNKGKNIILKYIIYFQMQ
ncbi:hypothetical protein GCM10028820_34220 [Tessaracoccus terricola]